MPAPENGNSGGTVADPPRSEVANPMEHGLRMVAHLIMSSPQYQLA